MDKAALVGMIAVVVCAFFSNRLCMSMAAQVLAQNGRKHFPMAFNFKLARSYRELFGTDGTYWQFVVLNVVYGIGLLVFGVSSLIYWLRG